MSYIEKVLKHPIQLVVPFASETFVSAINLGVPPVLSAPTSPIGALFEDISYAFSIDDDRISTPNNPSPSWTRVSERFKLRQKR